MKEFSSSWIPSSSMTTKNIVLSRYYILYRKKTLKTWIKKFYYIYKSKIMYLIYLVHRIYVYVCITFGNIIFVAYFYIFFVTAIIVNNQLATSIYWSLTIKSYRGWHRYLSKWLSFNFLYIVHFYILSMNNVFS